MAEFEEKIYESFEAQNEMVRSVLDLLLDTVPVITDATQKIAQAVAGGAAGSMASSEGGEGKGQEKGAQIDMGKLSESISGLGKGLAEFNLLAGGGTKFVKFVKSLTNALTRDGEIKDPAAVSTLYTSFGTAITAVGDSLGSIGLGMMVFALADAIGGPTAFTKFFDEFFTDERMTRFSDERATQFGKNLVAIGTSMKTMAITLALLTPAMIIAIPGLLLFAPAMLLVNFVMEKVGSQEGVQAMEGFTKSMTWFGLGLGTFVLAAVLTRFIEPQDLLMVAAITGVYLVTSLLFGFVMNEVGESGSESFAKSMAFFSLGLMAFEVAALGTRLLTMADIGKVTLIALSLTISALILSTVDDNITKGAEALIMISAALVVAELAIWLIDVLDLKPKSYLIAAGMMTALGLAALVLGESGQTVLLGAAATLVLSVSLIVTAFAVKMYEDIEWKTIGKAGAVLGALSVAAIAVGYAGPLVIAGAAATIMLGAALIVTAVAVKMYEDIDSKKAKAGLSVIPELMSTFAKAALKSPFVMIGSVAGLAAGAALLVIGHGLEKVTELNIKPDELVGTEQKPGTIRKILNSVITPFEDLGKKYTFSGGILGFLGRSNPVSDGINMTKGIGDVLCDIASGIKSFADLQFKNSKGELVTMADGDFDKVAENLEKVITCVSKAFIEVGKNNEYDLGANSSTTGSPTLDKVFSIADSLVGNNPLQNAIKSFSGVGQILIGIADGLKGFGELKFGNKSFASADFGPEGPIAKNIIMAISCVSKAFVEAYKKEIAPNGEGDGFVSAVKNVFKGNLKAAIDNLGDNPLEKAIASFSGITEISSGIIDVVDKLGKNAGNIDSNQIKTNISNVISGMTQGLIGINAEKLEDLNARKEYVKDVSSSIVNVAKNSDKLKESADALERISKALDDSFKTIQDLAEEKLTNVKEIFDALVALEEKESDRISDKMEKFGDMANKVGDKKSGSESSSANTDFSVGNAEDQGEKSGNKGGNDKELTEQLALMNKMLTEINTKLGGTLSVNVDDDGLSSILRRGSY